MQITDKGRALEDLFSTPAWHPIISLESVNGALWEEVRKNFLLLKKYLPCKEKIGEIAGDEIKELLKNNLIIDSRQISISTVKIFLKWLFCENHAELKEDLGLNQNENERIGNDFTFINQFINDNLLNTLFEASLEYRKEIAAKGPGDKIKKRNVINLVIDIVKKSKFKDLLNWDAPECYSVIMQPFIISPMINFSDIAVNLKENVNQINNYKTFSDFVEFCIFTEHPFPIYERYDAKTNTQYFIELASLKKLGFEGTVLNFGIGVRSCLGRLYAKEILANFFQPIFIKKDQDNSYLDSFQPKLNHLYSGRDNDKFNFWETVFQVKVLIKVLINEINSNF